MKILLVTPAYEPAWKYGGVISSNSTLCKELVKLGTAVTVYTTNASKSSKPLDVPLGVPVDVGGVTVFYFKSNLGPNNNFYSIDLTRMLRKTVSDFDIVYVVALWQWIGIATATICEKKGVPMVVAIKGGFSVRLRRKSYIKKQLFLKLFLRRALKKAAAIHLTNHAEKLAAGSWLDNFTILYSSNPADPGKYQLQANNGNSIHLLYTTDAVEPENYKISTFSRNTFRDCYGIPSNAPALICIARPDWKKRVELLIDAIDKMKHWYFIFVGEHDCEKGPEWKRYAERLGVSRRVIWTGFLSGEYLLAALAAADLFALVSENENFGMVVVEAMLCGLPVMLTEDVGVWEEIKGEQFAILVERSVDSIVKGMCDFQQRLQESKIDKYYIRKVAIDKFSPPVVARNFLTELKRIISVRQKYASYRGN